MRDYSITLTYSDGRLSFFQDQFEDRDKAFEFCESMLLLNESIVDINMVDSNALIDLENDPPLGEESERN